MKRCIQFELRCEPLSTAEDPHRYIEKVYNCMKRTTAMAQTIAFREQESAGVDELEQEFPELQQSSEDALGDVKANAEASGVEYTKDEATSMMEMDSVNERASKYQ